MWVVIVVMQQYIATAVLLIHCFLGQAFFLGLYSSELSFFVRWVLNHNSTLTSRFLGLSLAMLHTITAESGKTWTLDHGLDRWTGLLDSSYACECDERQTYSRSLLAM